MEVPPDEFKLPFFEESGLVRRRCPRCGSHYWSQDPESDTCGDAPCVGYTFIGNPPASRGLSLGEMREKFLSFFEERGHRRIAPYPVVARWRNDLMVTIASIVDFQPYVTDGVIPPPANPLVISQPCMRFEDIDLVGRTAGRHLTIFEMGGHHAFNPRGQPPVYWKDETVRYHHELLTHELGVPSEAVTYKEGLWSGGGNAGFDLEGCVGGLEISTLVFMMYRVVGDRFEPMPISVVDTGYGMERWSWLSQGAPSAFHAVYGPVLRRAFDWAGLTEIDEGLLAEASRLSSAHGQGGAGRGLAGASASERDELEDLLSSVESIYAALDHTKGMVFILSEGVVPSNVRQGYLARLLFRRSFRLLRRVGIEGRLPDLVEAQLEFWGRDFPQLRAMRDEVMEMAAVEGEKYRETLRRGSELVRRTLQRSRTGIAAGQLVELYDSHGLTPEDVAEAAAQEGVGIAVPEDFYGLVAMRHMKGKDAEQSEAEVGLKKKIEGLGKTRPLFYEDPRARDFDAQVMAVVDGRYLVLDRAAFYAEGGGQPSDTGWIARGSERLPVKDVLDVEGVLLHEVEGAERFAPGDEVRGYVDWERRTALMRSHTATHIILGAARRVLGEHAWQAGAQKGVERSRLDVSHFRKLTREEVETIESLANAVVAEGRSVMASWMPRDQAEARYGFRLYQGGAVPGKEIRVVEVEGWDAEACGGTHLENTHEAGLVKVVDTERVQDGVERIVFAVGPYALAEVQRGERALLQVAERLDVPLDRVVEAAADAAETVKNLRSELEALRRALSRQRAEALLAAAVDVEGVKLVVHMDRVDADLLIEVGNALAELEAGVVAVMFAEAEGRLIVKAGEAAVARGVHAGRLASELSGSVGGGGGGAPHFGQGGGGDVARFRGASAAIRRALEAQLAGRG